MFEEATKDDRWIKAMNEETHAIERDNTSELITLLKKKLVGDKWVYKTKYKPNGEVESFKVGEVSQTNKDRDTIIVYLSMDDLIFTGNNSNLLSEFREAMIARFEIIDTGLMSYFLGIELKQTNEVIFYLTKKICIRCFEEIQDRNMQVDSTPVEEILKLIKDGSGDLVDATNLEKFLDA
ncbi:hypothetical protein GH714_033766 [Hevea brasiliensis]|uniref:Reverse transcriptase Ty1/copia-type domain-containing protein n=1 Tax=Hevea brasiliensis TaxID=3981 RepID=A0A6A6NAG1_HEVBR|nr:hypothetical protein GH714_033766 [Hevea brasiliensis]